MSFPADMDAHAFVEHALEATPAWSVVRSDDPKWLVHSTTVQNWTAIHACGELYSLACLQQAGIASGGIGFTSFGEPEDYAEYVMLARAGVMAPEFVVASQQAGCIITQEDTPYEPGARLFFNGRQMIQDGLIVRDGLHEAKVHDHLPLEPYLVASVTKTDLDPEGKVAVWTPRTFCLTALEYFSNIVGEPVPYEHWC